MGTSLEWEGVFLCVILTGHHSKLLFPVSHIATQHGGWDCIWSLSLELSGKVKLLRICREPVEVAQCGQGWLGQWGTWWSSADLVAPFSFLVSCRRVWLFMEVLRGGMRVCDPKFETTTHCLLSIRRRHFWTRWWISPAGAQGDLGVLVPDDVPAFTGQSPKQPVPMSELALQGTGGWTWDLQRSLPSYYSVVLSKEMQF